MLVSSLFAPVHVGWPQLCRAGRNFGRTFGSNMASQAMYLNLERLGAQVGLHRTTPTPVVALGDHMPAKD